MPWKECSLMSSRLEFVKLAQAPDANFKALCEVFRISRKTGYKWIQRYGESGAAGLQDRSRRPHSSPHRSTANLEAAVLALHEAYPCWGGRKLEKLLPSDSPHPHFTTIDAILKRHRRQLVPLGDSGKPASKRFEHEAPNLLWQMDFKGHFALTDSRAQRCHPLTVLDDHSRFNICLVACSAETAEQVGMALTQAFREYGLPERITCDNGVPWGTTGRETLSALEVWLLRLGIRVGHSRPYHPQTQGKDERFHRTLKRELIERFGFNSIELCQAGFNHWRNEYNLIRPHRSLGELPPISRYRPSGRRFPATLPPIEYDDGDEVRKVKSTGQISYKNKRFFVGEGLTGQIVAIRPTTTEGVVKVFFCSREVRTLDLRERA